MSRILKYGRNKYQDMDRTPLFTISLTAPKKKLRQSCYFCKKIIRGQ